MKNYHKNPRSISKEQFAELQKDLAELGDLSGVIHDLNSDEIVGGNQRSRVFNINKCKIVMTEIFDQPDEQGTVGLGYVVWQGKKYAYRQVKWSPDQCERANLIANLPHASWDFEAAANGFRVEVLQGVGFNQSLLQEWNTQAGGLRLFLESNFNYAPATNPETGAVDVSDRDIEKGEQALAGRFHDDPDYLPVTCPHCGRDFFVNKKDLK